MNEVMNHNFQGNNRRKEKSTYNYIIAKGSTIFYIFQGVK
jgi:hypothetical protein